MRIMTVIGGVVVALLGLLFTLQGLDVIGGSGMSGKTLWAVLGPIILVVGLIAAARGMRPSQPSRDLS